MLQPTRAQFVFSRIVFLWQWKYTVYFILAGTAVTVAHEVTDLHLELPTLPLAVVGAALGIFVSFRTNQAYDRWWEGRKLWGRLINESRHWASQIVSYVGDEAVRKRLVYRHASYVHTLRCMLRTQDPLADEEVTGMLQDEVDTLRDETNLTHALLSKQLDEVVALEAKKELDAFRVQSLDATLRELINIQGGCERIKKTPMPPLYAILATRLVQFYAVLFPAAVIHDLGWWTIPVNLLVCTAFSLIAEAGRVLEDPFTTFYNGLPLHAISRMIEVNTRQRLGETDLPPMLVPTAGGVLM